jgi:hypothetical protein
VHAYLEFAPDPDQAASELAERLAAVRQEIAGDEWRAPVLLGLDQATGEEPPCGPGWAAWLDYLVEWLPDYRSEASGEERSEPRAVRTGRFGSHREAEIAATVILRASENRLRRWAADPTEGPRLHLSGDIGCNAGEVTCGEPVAGEVQPTRHAAVLMFREPDGGRPYIKAVYPELALCGPLRRAHPDLGNLLGGWFGPDQEALDGDGWAAERDYCLNVPIMVRHKAYADLEELLGQVPNEAAGAWLVEQVIGLGGCVPTSDVVRWLRGMLRRGTKIDWGETAVAAW